MNSLPDSRGRGIFILFLAVLTLGLTNPAAAGFESRGIEEIWSVSAFGESDYFFRPSDITVDPALERIYVADSGNHRIAVFDFEGKYIYSIGREGQGPGEFLRPTGICLLPDSGLAVADFGNTRIQIFDRDGEFMKVITTHGLKAADLIMHDGLFYTIPSFGDSGFALNLRSEETSQPLLTVIDLEGGRVRDFAVDDFPENQPFIRSLKHSVCMALSPQGTFYLPYRYKNLIQVFDFEGKKLTEFDRPLPFKPITPKLESQQTDGDVVRMSASLDEVSPAAQFGPDGRLFVLTYTASFHKLIDGAKDMENRPPFPMRIDVIDPKNHKSVDSIACDPNLLAFSVMDRNRLVYICEDPEAELVMKCIRLRVRKDGR